MSYTLPKMPDRAYGNPPHVAAQAWGIWRIRGLDRPGVVTASMEDGVLLWFCSGSPPPGSSPLIYVGRTYGTEADAWAGLMHDREQLHRCEMELLEREYRKASQPPAEAER